jgi:hypothetical protein
MENMTTKTTVSYEHRVIAPHVDGDGITFEVGFVLERTRSPRKRCEYSKTGCYKSFSSNDGTIPAEKVGVYEVVKVTVTTTTETERLVR